MRNRKFSKIMKDIKILLRRIVLVGIQALLIVCTPFLFVVAFAVRVIRKQPTTFLQRRVVFGGCGLINHAKWSKALKQIGVPSKTMVWGTPGIYSRDLFDYDLQQKWGIASYLVAPFVFLKTIAKTDVVVCGFDGFILGTTNLRKIEIHLLRLSGCKVIVIPYGADAFIYRNIYSNDVKHVLQISYAEASRRQESIEKDVRRNVRSADFIFMGMMSFDGFGRWDALSPSSLIIDTRKIVPAASKNSSSKLVVAHTPNHRGFKGTEFIIAAVENLQKEGLEIELLLLEKVPNQRVLEVLSKDVDVLVEQIIAPGYGLSGVEGFATGCVVISNLSDELIMRPFRRWSFLNECPAVSATPESIEEVLRNLYDKPELRKELSTLSRMYAEKYHSHETFQEFYRATDAYLFEQGPELINFYHPLIGQSMTVKDKLKTPLIDNQIV
jgi:glycosyltransferase involved in cell wall biosynthesis